ncbi:MAG: phosphoribosylaminoimidazolesuccinocarboxamide synthase [Saprospiraceae bacterium]|nr:phosphoribosylaminoimidazolesuccinocarboxamide synthase [Saprospiraceae bacterium]
MSLNSESCTLRQTHFTFDGLKNLYHGKVRDVYAFEDLIILVATDRISAFDHILPKAIPFKGQVLNQIATYFLRNTADIVPNWFIESPDPNVSIGHKTVPVKLEMVVRGYLSGHAWRTYRSGIAQLCGVTMPSGMKENDRFPTPIITPTTKATEGHDMDISEEEILEQGIVTESEWNTLKNYALKLFEAGSKMAMERGLILVDTKYEFGKLGDEIVLIDEVHTPDSSRYFYADGYEDRQNKGEAQPQLSKEFVREWLIAHHFQGLEGQTMPDMPEDFVWQISDRYIQLYEKITGNAFHRDFDPDITARVERNINHFLSHR